MTIIIGIVCKDAIIVASDSQTTWGHSSKSTRAEKIHQVDFQDAAGLLATSGNVTFAYRVAEITQDACARMPLTDRRQLAEAVEKAVTQMRGVLVEPYRGFGVTAEGFEKLFEMYNYSLLVANYFGGQPQLYTIDFPPGVAAKRTDYAAVGCGATLAEFLLSWFPFSAMGRTEAAITAAFIIGEVKKADAFCGGPTQIRWIDSGEVKPGGFDREVTQIIETQVEAGSVQYKQIWSAEVSKMVQKITKRIQDSLYE